MAKMKSPPAKHALKKPAGRSGRQGTFREAYKKRLRRKYKVKMMGKSYRQ